MSPETLKISLEFTRKEEAADPYAFSFKRQEYHVRHTHGDLKAIVFPWDDPEIQQALEALEHPEPDRAILERLGKRLRGFLNATNWARDEADIERALEARRPIDITIRSNAAEMYWLPWELLTLEHSKVRLCQLDDCLIRYQWQQKPPGGAAPSNPGRVLFAYSNAGGQVPWKDHLTAIESACQAAGVSFDFDRDVIRNVTRKSLSDALSDESHPITVLHLLCHGTPTREGTYGLAFSPMEEGEQRDVLDAEEVQRLLPAPGTPPRLIVLCACQGGDAGRPAHQLGGIAHRLHCRGVPAVLASRLPLSVKGSTQLTQALYKTLLAGHGDLRKALSEARKELKIIPKSTDWVSLQLYAREGDEGALHPFGGLAGAAPGATTPRRDIILIRHEAHATTDKTPEVSPRKVRQIVHLEPTPELLQRRWEESLEQAVANLASPEGRFLRALAEPDAEFGYYGFPFVPLAVLAGYIAGRTRHVHVFEPDPASKEFRWQQQKGTYPELKLEELPGAADVGALRLRLSVSSKVHLEDCQRVLPDKSVRRDLHLSLEPPRPEVVRWEEQSRKYVEKVRDSIYQCVEKEGSAIKSVHLFAAIPVSIAFLLGQSLSATWLPNSYVYNFGREESPRYKWRLGLREAYPRKSSGRPAIKIFKK